MEFSLMIWAIWERRDFEVSKTSGPLMVIRTSNWSERRWFWTWTMEATPSPFFTMKAFWKILNLLSIILLILICFLLLIKGVRKEKGFHLFSKQKKRKNRPG